MTILIKFFINDIKSSFLRNKLVLFWQIIFPIILMLFIVRQSSLATSFKCNLIPQNASIEQITKIKNTLNDYQIKTINLSNTVGSKDNDKVVVDFSKKTIDFDGGSSWKSYYVELVLYKLMLDIKGNGWEINSHHHETSSNKSKSYKKLFFISGILALQILALGLYSVSLVINSYIRLGVLKNLLILPVRISTYIFSLILSRLFIIVLQALFILAFSSYYFNLKGLFNIWLIPAIFLGGVTFVAFGFMLGFLIKNNEVSQIVNHLLFYFFMFTNPVYFEKTQMMPLLNKISYVLPFYHVLTIIRSALYDGSAFLTQFDSIIILLIWLSVSFFISILLFKRRVIQ